MMVMGGCKGMCEGVKTFRRCENHHTGRCERCYKSLSGDVEV